MGRLRKKTLSNDEAHVQLTHLLNEHGKKEEMKELLMNHLKETGWRDQVSIAMPITPVNMIWIDMKYPHILSSYLLVRNVINLLLEQIHFLVT